MRVGDLVQLGDKPQAGMARIELKYKDIEGGVRLNKALDGFVSWNVKDLVKVPKVGAKPRQT